MRFVRRIVTPVLLAALLAPFGAQGATAATPGVTTFTTTITDTTRGVVCTATGRNDASRALEVIVARPTGGTNLPVLFLAHGFSGHPDAGGAEGIAALGYLVVAPRFPSSSGNGFNGECAVEDLRNQPKDVSFLLTALTDRSQGFSALPAGTADVTRVGIKGNSGGGITGLLFFNSCCLDPRIDAVASTYGYPPQAMRFPWDFEAASGTAAMLVNSRTDPTIPYAEARLGWEQMVGPRFMVSIPGDGTHMLPAGRPRAVDQAPVAFLDVYVKGDASRRHALLHAFDDVPTSQAVHEFDLPSAGTPEVRRIGGAGRVETAALASGAAFGPRSAQGVVLTRSDDFADALAGAPLAQANGGPLLLTPKTSLHAATSAEIERVLAPGGTIHLLGGSAVLSPEVEAQARALGYRVERHAGVNRFATALEVAAELGHPGEVFLADGFDAQEALLASATAASRGAALLLTNRSAMEATTATYLRARGPALHAVGAGAAAAAPASATRTTAADVVALSVALARAYHPERPISVGVAVSTNYADALGAGAMLAERGGPLLLTPRAGLDARVASYLTEVDSAELHFSYLFGLQAALTDTVRVEMQEALD